jgi:hypothetical protein
MAACGSNSASAPYLNIQGLLDNPVPDLFTCSLRQIQVGTFSSAQALGAATPNFTRPS